MPGNDKPEDKVREYYDRNTGHFLRFGATSGTRAIHQPLFLSPDYSLRDALEAPYRLITQHRASIQKKGIQWCDLGCGVGDGMLFLIENGFQDGDRISGITISEQQAGEARRLLAKSGFADNSEVICASFQEASLYISNIHLAYAIESFIHSPDLRALLNEVAKILEPGGQLIIFDDFLARIPSSRSDERIMTDFRNGWQANSIYTVQQVNDMARDFGLSLQASKDHSDALKLNRFRDKVVRVFTPLVRPLMGRHTYAMFLVGGNARQEAYSEGLLAYLELVFVKD